MIKLKLRRLACSGLLVLSMGQFVVASTESSGNSTFDTLQISPRREYVKLPTSIQKGTFGYKDASVNTELDKVHDAHRKAVEKTNEVKFKFGILRTIAVDQAKKIQELELELRRVRDSLVSEIRNRAPSRMAVGGTTSRAPSRMDGATPANGRLFPSTPTTTTELGSME